MRSSMLELFGFVVFAVGLWLTAPALLLSFLGLAIVTAGYRAGGKK